MEPLADLIIRRGFDRFQDGLRSRFCAYRFRYTLTYCEPAGDPAVCIDLESLQQTGRLIAWASGACDLEVLDAATGRNVLWEHYDLQSEDEFHQALARLAVFMRDATS